MEKFELLVKPYYDALEKGKILARKCRKCGSIMYPPMPICQDCSSTDVECIELSGKAKLLNFGKINPHHIWPEMAPFLPLRWGEVELEEGVSLTGTILGITDDDDEYIEKHLPVSLKTEIIQMDGFKTVAFRYVKE